MPGTLQGLEWTLLATVGPLAFNAHSQATFTAGTVRVSVEQVMVMVGAEV